MRKFVVPVLVVVVVLAFILVSCQVSRAGYESAPYRVVRSTGDFEVRDYPALTVAETPMAVNGVGSDGSFNRLFRFISGGNNAQQKIAMTTPVIMSGTGAEATMAFVMPATMKEGVVPKPQDEAVKVREIDAGRFVSLRFSGGRSPENEADALRRLKEWMADQGLAVSSSPVYAYFDPPWTPVFLRRNEVMVRTTGEN